MGRKYITEKYNFYILLLSKVKKLLIACSTVCVWGGGGGEGTQSGKYIGDHDSEAFSAI